MNRYNSGEDEFEPGSDGLVLRNKLGITDPKEIAVHEYIELERAFEEFTPLVSADQVLDVAFACELHRQWLGDIYDWAGQLRTVNVSKTGMMFAPVGYFPQSIREFDTNIAARLTPARFEDRIGLATALAEYHADFILLHPFREGNGRVSRWLAQIMAYQAQAGTLDFSGFGESEDALRRYFAAVRRGIAGEMESLTQIFEASLP